LRKIEDGDAKLDQGRGINKQCVGP